MSQDMWAGVSQKSQAPTELQQEAQLSVLVIYYYQSISGCPSDILCNCKLGPFRENRKNKIRNVKKLQSCKKFVKTRSQYMIKAQKEQRCCCFTKTSLSSGTPCTRLWKSLAWETACAKRLFRFKKQP